MKCKNCGGELLLQNKTYQCNNCGTVFVLDSIYENIDVYLCYEESDTSGRRTKDSIAAQEIYRKLEKNKIASFYERISTDGTFGDDLEIVKISAIQQSKIVIIIGTSIESFTTLEKKYGSLIKSKIIIPFCVDVNPNTIPKTLSKIQAINYSTIGWEQDLINGIYKILGRKKSVDANKRHQKKNRKVVIISIFVALLLFLGVGIWLFLNTDTTNPIKTTKLLSQNEIYDNANDLFTQGNLIEALNLYLQIPEHPDSENSINLIYEKYEGYYWDETNNFSLYFTISGNKKAEIEINYYINETRVNIAESGQININEIHYQYIDSENNSGKLTIYLKNECIFLDIQPETSSKNSIKQKKFQFQLNKKSDKPHSKIADAKTLQTWANNKTSISEISRMGFDLDELGLMFVNSRGIEAYGYKIKNTDIQILAIPYDESTWFQALNDTSNKNDMRVLGISAPASIILPDKIGKASPPFVYGNYIFVPYGEFSSSPEYYLSLGGYHSFWKNSKQKVTADTPVCFISKKYIQQDTWNDLYESNVGEYLCEVQIQNDITICQDRFSYESRRADILALSNSNILVVVSREILDGNLTVPASAAYYSVDKQTYKATLIYEYQIPESERSSYMHMEIYKLYPDIFGEFLDS